jgi:antibiotic biosynthesis monooxygenase (ABM) superfamily enzyme
MPKRTPNNAPETRIASAVTRTLPSASPGVGPPTKHQLAAMIWLAVFPTLTAINLMLGGWLRPMPSVLRTFVLATIAVPIVIYAAMPQLHKARARILMRLLTK